MALSITGQYGRLKDGRSVIVNKFERIEFFEKWHEMNWKTGERKKRTIGKTYTIQYETYTFSGQQYNCEKGASMPTEISEWRLLDCVINSIDVRKKTIVLTGMSGQITANYMTLNGGIMTMADVAEIPQNIDICIGDNIHADLATHELNGKKEYWLQAIVYDCTTIEKFQKVSTREYDNQRIWKMVAGQMTIIHEFETTVCGRYWKEGYSKDSADTMEEDLEEYYCPDDGSHDRSE